MRERTDEKNTNARARTTERTVDETRRTRTDREGTIPVIEEDVQIGKQSVETGGMRVESHVTERPVQEDVNLREEHVRLNREAVDRPLTAADRDAFREQSIEMTERAERPVVSKQARVVEEVSLEKDVSSHTERVADTVRRTDVEVTPIRHEAVDRSGYDRIAPKMRSHYDSKFASSGIGFENYDRAYRYGYELAGDKRVAGADWKRVEPQAQQTWESHNKGTWEKFKDAVRHGFDLGR